MMGWKSRSGAACGGIIALRQNHSMGEAMKRFRIVQSDADIVSHSGLVLLGRAVSGCTDLKADLDDLKLRHGTRHSDVMLAYTALVALGKNDFEAIKTIDSREFFSQALGIERIPSEATLRQRMDQRTQDYLPVLTKANRDFLVRSRPTLSPVSTGHVPLDVDVTPFDNSASHKEGVSWTYKRHDGYSPIAGYLGGEGYCLGMELRPGHQHCQKDTPAFLRRMLADAGEVTDQPVLLRLDGGNDAISNVEVALEYNERFAHRAPADFLIKWNPRQVDHEQVLAEAEAHGHWRHPREGKRVALYSTQVSRRWRGYDYSVRRAMRVTERTIDADGQHLLQPQITIEGWWTSLSEKESTIIDIYADHGTSEQFHSEFKTDLDIERLPSGKFATNALVVATSVLAYNLLRWIGQQGLIGAHAPRRHKAKRRRLRTVMQELMYVAARLVRTGRRLRLSFSRHCPAFDAFNQVYEKLAYP